VSFTDFLGKSKAARRICESRANTLHRTAYCILFTAFKFFFHSSVSAVGELHHSAADTQAWTRFAIRKLAAGLVILTLLLALAPTLFTGLTDTHDWFQFVVPALVFALVAFWAFRFHAVRIPRVLIVDGVAATATGWLCVVLSLVSGYFAVVVFIRWFYS